MIEKKRSPTDNARILEALLFASPTPLSIKNLVQITEFSEDKIKNTLEEMRRDYQNRGMKIREVAEGFEMCTDSSLHIYIERLNKITTQYNLSKASLETLAIIAYNQPVTRGEIEQLRGVRGSKILSKLLNLKLIRITGKSDKIGRPFVYGTTKQFLRYFGLKSLEELPNIEINEGLSGENISQ